MTRELSVTSATPDETESIGAVIGRMLQPGQVVLLYGDLGAGKTQLARGMARGLGVDGPVTSPTFTLINEYQGRIPFYHSDLFRLSDPGQLVDLGLDDYLYGEGATVVEWPERLGALRPGEYLAVTLQPTPTGRQLALSATGAGYEELLARVAEALEERS